MPPSVSPSSSPRILLYILRRDLRLADNPVFHDIARLRRSAVSGDTPKAASDAPPQLPHFTHLLPVYVFPAQQIEVSGFLAQPGQAGSENSQPVSPYPEARSRVGGFWRCGPHRAKFIAESVWDLKSRLEDVKSDLVVRVGMVADVVRDILDAYNRGDKSDVQQSDGEDKGDVIGVVMTSEEGTEEKQEERDVRRVVEKHDKKFKLYEDEKYFLDDRDLPFKNISDLPDIFTTFRKSVEPLRAQPRSTLPTPSELPSLPSYIPPQTSPFAIPGTLDELKKSLLAPLKLNDTLKKPPTMPSGAVSAHPFRGGERKAAARIQHLLYSGSMSAYSDTRNGMLGTDFSTKLSAFLALGCVSARQVHAALSAFEDGKAPSFDALVHQKDQPSIDASEWQKASGFGAGENKGTASVRFELLWRDYMRLCHRKFGARLFDLHGFRRPEAHSTQPAKQWRSITAPNGSGDREKADITRARLQRFLTGTTGLSLIDAAERELFLTGYTSNRTRQNVASFLASHMEIDWRLGAEWYESMLVDYDVASNWGNWAYVAGVGNDPRQGRVFNPVKQGLDYDKRGEYVKTWVEELRRFDISDAADNGAGGKNGQKNGPTLQDKLVLLLQPSAMGPQVKEEAGLANIDWINNPVLRIPFRIPGGQNSSYYGRGGRGGRGRGRSRGGGGRGRPGDAGPEGRRGMMDKAGMTSA